MSLVEIAIAERHRGLFTGSPWSPGASHGIGAATAGAEGSSAFSWGLSWPGGMRWVRAPAERRHRCRTRRRPRNAAHRAIAARRCPQRGRRHPGL